jgi:hypothetical protein
LLEISSNASWLRLTVSVVRLDVTCASVESLAPNWTHADLSLVIDWQFVWALSRLVFTAPTQYYKVGVVWLAYLIRRQDHFRMIGGFESGRSLQHLADLVRAGDAIDPFTDPDQTAARASAYFAVTRWSNDSCSAHERS